MGRVGQQTPLPASPFFSRTPLHRDERGVPIPDSNTTPSVGRGLRALRDGLVESVHATEQARSESEVSAAALARLSGQHLALAEACEAALSAHRSAAEAVAQWASSESRARAALGSLAVGLATAASGVIEYAAASDVDLEHPDDQDSEMEDSPA